MTATEDRPRWKRVILKLSGEALAEPTGFGLDTNVLHQVATEIKDVRENLKIDIAVVVGGAGLTDADLGATHLLLELRPWWLPRAVRRQLHEMQEQHGAPGTQPCSQQKHGSLNAEHR